MNSWDHCNWLGLVMPCGSCLNGSAMGRGQDVLTTCIVPSWLMFVLTPSPVC